jgi:transposase InsO family protein
LEDILVKISVSDKASPWQNGYKESFFGWFKDEIGDLDRFDTLGELVEEIYAYIFYYNNLRIHTRLKMPPVVFRKQFLDEDNVS